MAAISPGVRRRSGWALAASAGVTLVCTQLAVSSGYRFDELVSEVVNTDDHERLGLMTRNLVGLFFLAAVASAAMETWGPSDREGRPAAIRWALIGVTAVSAVLSTVWAVRTGDEGARLVWEGVLVVRVGQ